MLHLLGSRTVCQTATITILSMNICSLGVTRVEIIMDWFQGFCSGLLLFLMWSHCQHRRMLRGEYKFLRREFIASSINMLHKHCGGRNHGPGPLCLYAVENLFVLESAPTTTMYHNIGGCLNPFRTMTLR